MGIKTYNPYTPSRRNMTGSDFQRSPRRHLRNHFLTARRRTLDVITRVRLPLDIRAAETDRNTDLSISREITRMEFLQQLSESNMIQTEQQISL